VPPSPPIRLRRFRTADYDSVLALWKRSEGIGLNESDTREAIARYLRRNTGMSLVAVRGSRIVAAILCGHDGRRGYLHHLAVSRRWRRGGVGSRLVAACLERLREEGIPKCNLFLFASNRTGRAFWRRIGWSVRRDLELVQAATAPGSSARRKGC
jgi:ribosomal protein S18 acetylase RimI-like enzyme